MRLINADELIEHAYRDKLDSRELIAAMINNAPTVKEIPMNVPLSLVIKALEQEQRTDVFNKMIDDIQTLRGCSCDNSDGIIDDVEDIIDKYRQEG